MLFFCAWASAEVELLIVGDAQSPVKFVVLPFTYQGEGLSPAVTVENHITQALSSTGLFAMPYQYEKPKDIDNLLAWQFAGIRYVIQGELTEYKQSLTLRLSIADTKRLEPTLSTVILMPDQLVVSTQLFADQMYRSMFYTTFTNEQNKQFLHNENATLTQYLNQLVMTFKSAWQHSQSTGACTVAVQQMPGGVPFKSKLQDNCFVDQGLANEIQQVMDGVDVLPYQNFQDVFIKDLKLQFVAVN